MRITFSNLLIHMQRICWAYGDLDLDIAPMIIHQKKKTDEESEVEKFQMNISFKRSRLCGDMHMSYNGQSYTAAKVRSPS